MCGVTRLNKISNDYIRGSLKVVPVIEKIRCARWSWYGHVMRRDERHATRRVIDINVDVRSVRDPKKR